MGSLPTPRVAVVIPCLDEARTIEKVVKDFSGRRRSSSVSCSIGSTC